MLVRRSKTDQCSAGKEVAVWVNPTELGCCPLAALQAGWDFRRLAADGTGRASDAALPLFVGLSKAGQLSGVALSDKAVWRLVRDAAKAAGIEG
ncbi:MAG: hypothetical protein JWP20_2213 [Roseomonas sp.]|nr:hypothetical protein [Roseomonas sp.]